MEAEIKPSKRRNPKETANPLSVFSFFYMLPIFYRNYKNGVTENDLYEPLEEHRAKKLGDRLEDLWKQQHRKHKNSALQWSFLKIFWWPLTVTGIARLILEILLITVVPFSIGGLSSYFDSSSDTTKDQAYIYAGLLILSMFVDLFFNCHTNLIMTHIGMKLRVSCCSVIYRKSLRLSQSALGQTTIGQIVNLLSNDVGKFDESFLLCHYVWVSPIQTVVGTYLLYRMMGYTAFIGMGILMLFVPLQFYFGKRTSQLRLRTALRTDERVRLMNEILHGIQVIKMYSWEKPFAKLISFARRYEIKSIRANFFLEAITFCLEMVITRLAVFVTIIVYVYSGNELSAEVVFTLISIYEVLRASMGVLFSYGISAIAEVYVTLSRIQKFLSYEELSPDRLISNGLSVLSPEKLSMLPNISLNHVTAQWNPESSEATLTDINLTINHSQLVAIVGKVGSGKSSLFNVILKELPITKGSIDVKGKISYACQEAWLFSASIRQNILFGDPYIEDRYKTILKICALEDDLVLMPYGDKTIVGEKGKVLSGGQKARINLARCIYKQADIYLLDDPLSAVDTKVGKHLFEECIRKFLSDKICILITHQLQYLSNTDKILILEGGKIVEEGSYNELQRSGLEFAKLLCEFTSTEEQDGDKKHIKSRQNSEISENKTDDDDDSPDVDEETVQSGNISLATYMAYLRYGGNFVVIALLILAVTAAKGAGSASDFYISEWVNLEQQATEDGESGTVDRDSIIYGYSGIMIAIIISAIIYSVFFFIFFMRASVNMHDSVFAKISYATMKFFNVNPTGRILNRFSKDLGTIDEYLPYLLYDVVQIMLSFVSTIILTGIVNPWLLIPSAILLIIFYSLRKIYLKTTRSVKRIEGITRSPIYSHMTATMNGLSTVRAFNAQQILMKEFDDHLDLHSSTWYLYLTSNKAFDFLLTLIGTTTVSLISVALLLLDRDYYGGEAGLILTQYMSMSGMLEWGMRVMGELENNMVSVERVLEYTKVETEPVREPSVLPRDWPEFGKISFENVSMRYKPEEPFVLHDLNFTICPKEKVGIVGRTGAGKSSIIATLFQLYDMKGTIIIDDVDTTKLPLDDLRSKISIIPQEPVLFSGPLRKNLDPFDEYNDDVLWNALEQVKLKDLVKEWDAGLSSNVTEGGSNFSVGQRQLVCLARAILRNNKILVMDEATANVDPHTDAIIQETIRKKFVDCTVVTIAHRLHTIMDSDKVLVIDTGKLVEFEHPHTLLQNKHGNFYTMVETTGTATANNLRNIAEKSYEKKHV